MISFHLTELRNLPSILSSGLIGRKPKLDHHLEVFQNEGLIGDKVVYTWGETWRNSKYAKDMVYCKQWIDPRNVLDIKDDTYDFSKEKKCRFKNERYVLLKVDTKEDESNIFGPRWMHGQTASDDPFNALFQMDTEFEHEDKPLVMFKENVKSEYIIPIELYDSEVVKGKLHVRNRPYEGWRSKAHSGNHCNR